MTKNLDPCSRSACWITYSGACTSKIAEREEFKELGLGAFRCNGNAEITSWA